MRKPALLLAAPALVLGLATLAVAQDNDPEQYWAVGDGPPWYLQRSTCTLAHNTTGDSLAVVRFRIGMGVEIEFLDPALRRVRVDEPVPIVLSVDGAREEGLGTGIDEGDRRGYRLWVSAEMFARIRTGQRLEASTRGRTLLRLDLGGADRAVAAMEACNLELAAEAVANGNELDPFANASVDWNGM